MDINSIALAAKNTEFIGTAIFDTIGIVISGIDYNLLDNMNVGKKYRALGAISSRTGAAGQITAMDDALKMTNAEILSVELPRDTKGWGGHGNYILIGADDVADVKMAVKTALNLCEKYAGGVYVNDAGHIELAYTANAGPVIEKTFHAERGEAFGFMAGSPAAIGLVMADAASKSAEIEIVEYMTPNHKTSLTNEVIIAFSGDAAAVKTALRTAREKGLMLLGQMAEEPTAFADPYF